MSTSFWFTNSSHSYLLSFMRPKDLRANRWFFFRLIPKKRVKTLFHLVRTVIFCQCIIFFLLRDLFLFSIQKDKIADLFSLLKRRKNFFTSARSRSTYKHTRIFHSFYQQMEINWIQFIYTSIIKINTLVTQEIVARQHITYSERRKKILSMTFELWAILNLPPLFYVINLGWFLANDPNVQMLLANAVYSIYLFFSSSFYSLFFRLFSIGIRALLGVVMFRCIFLYGKHYASVHNIHRSIFITTISDALRTK